MEHDRDDRDAAGIGPYAREREHLVPMSKLASWTVTEGDADIRGWEVRTVAGRQLGNVADLLVDEAAGEVVMLDIDLPASDRHTFVPIRVVQIDRPKRVVLMDSADLPEAGLNRGGGTTDVNRPADTGTVRYPTTDRQVEMGRAARADDVLVAGGPDDRPALAERRRGERRRIERVNTDL